MSLSISSFELVDKVLLGLVGHAVRHRYVRNFKDVKDDLVYFKFDVDMSEFIANGHNMAQIKSISSPREVPPFY